MHALKVDFLSAGHHKKMHHGDEVVLRQALVGVYELESRVAIYPSCQPSRNLLELKHSFHRERCVRRESSADSG